jgi:glycosyltransferase involved in cell wall biosynthesis
MSQLTVALCTHNPRKEFIEETLSALRRQTLPLSDWSLLIIDNASKQPLAQTLDLSWHPDARIVREDKLGTAHARYRSMLEFEATAAELILYVDDDNILAPDYLKTGLALATQWPQLACWGGQLIARYEESPPSWLENYKKLLAIFPLEKPMWANCVHSYDVVPPTAGCFIRRPVWQKYLSLVAENPKRLTLGAQGNIQIRGEDTDLVLSAIDLGLGVGRFPELKLEHIMPAGRISAAYVENLVEGVALGGCVLNYIRNGTIPAPSASGPLQKLSQIWRASRLPEPLASFYKAELRGRDKAVAMIAGWRRAATKTERP